LSRTDAFLFCIEKFHCKVLLLITSLVPNPRNNFKKFICLGRQKTQSQHLLQLTCGCESAPEAACLAFIIACIGE
jgi:hypothetical protein